MVAARPDLREDAALGVAPEGDPVDADALADAIVPTAAEPVETTVPCVHDRARRLARPTKGIIQKTSPSRLLQ
jgi:hypothetical protein